MAPILQQDDLDLPYSKGFLLYIIKKPDKALKAESGYRLFLGFGREFGHSQVDAKTIAWNKA